VQRESVRVCRNRNLTLTPNRTRVDFRDSMPCRSLKQNFITQTWLGHSPSGK
jgi:hypothetical protein